MNVPECWLTEKDAKTIMMVGVGGGFDIFVGLPFVHKWPEKQFILVNSSPDSSFLLEESNPDKEEHYPQNQISQHPNIIANYTVGKHGTGLLKKVYDEIIEKHKPDLILGVDGGVDSLMVGDEAEKGTILEDFNVLGALSQLDIEHKVLCCAGFGAETEENVNHYRVLENIAKISADGWFYGSFSLMNWWQEFIFYKVRCESAWENNRRKSHIQTKIISAAEGAFPNNKYEDVDARVTGSTDVTFVSPLSSIYWLFNLDKVVERNKLIPFLKKANTFIDSKMILRQHIGLPSSSTRTKEVIPL